jgi:catechol 2,3-dioxygenase-like lactoylglutathione lyase family enzyme
VGKTIRPFRLNHMNVVVEDFDASVRHFDQVYGAEFMVDIPQKEMHACLLGAGRVLFELFAPHAYLLNSRYGPHFLGVEYQAEMEVVREVVADHGLRIVRDIGIALHTHPADAFGISFEFCGHEFVTMDWPLLGGRIRPLEYWRDEHPAGFAGLGGYTVAVWDLPAALAFYQSFLGAEPMYETERAGIGARAVGVRISDDVVELLAPTGAGELQQHLLDHGQGIRSTRFRVRSLEQVRRYFRDRGVELVPGAAESSLAVPADANLGVIFEFAEHAETA